MRKILVWLIVAVLFGFIGCETGTNGPMSYSGPSIENSQGDHHLSELGLFVANIERLERQVAYMFGYGICDRPTSLGAGQTIFVAPDNRYKGPNERSGVCLDYAIHFALLTDAYIVSNSTDNRGGVWKLIGPAPAGTIWTGTGNSNRALIPGTNQSLAQSWDRTELWILEKVEEFNPNLNPDPDNPALPNHVWNLLKCRSLITDITALDTGFGSSGRWLIPL